MLTDSQVQQYREQGFLLGGRVLDDVQVEALREELARVIRDDKKPGIPQPVLLRNLNQRNPAQPVWQIVNIWEASATFHQLIYNAHVVEAAARLGNAKQLRVWHDQIQYKPAETGGVNTWHQDSPYWPTIMPKTTQLTAWIALDDVDESNGCMSMIPGSHLWGNQVDFLHALPSFEGMPAEWDGHALKVTRCPVKKGHVHFHHCLTWHGSHANTSGRPRRAIAIHFMNEQTIYYAEGQHPMKPFIKVPNGAMLEGDHFPLVWDGKVKMPRPASVARMAA